MSVAVAEVSQLALNIFDALMIMEQVLSEFADEIADMFIGPVAVFSEVQLNGVFVIPLRVCETSQSC